MDIKSSHWSHELRSTQIRIRTHHHISSHPTAGREEELRKKKKKKILGQDYCSYRTSSNLNPDQSLSVKVLNKIRDLIQDHPLRITVEKEHNQVITHLWLWWHPETRSVPYTKLQQKIFFFNQTASICQWSYKCLYPIHQLGAKDIAHDSTWRFCWTMQSSLVSCYTS